jgi:hypothetical protein
VTPMRISTSLDYREVSMSDLPSTDLGVSVVTR